MQRKERYGASKDVRHGLVLLFCIEWSKTQLLLRRRIFSFFFLATFCQNLKNVSDAVCLQKFQIDPIIVVSWGNIHIYLLTSYLKRNFRVESTLPLHYKEIFNLKFAFVLFCSHFESNPFISPIPD
jgi:hypothetical protein